MTDDGSAAAAAWPIVFAVDGTAERRRHSQHAKEITRDEQGLDVANFPLRREIDAGIGKRQKLGKRLLMRANLVPERKGYLAITSGVPATAWPVETDFGQFVGIRDGKTTQTHGVEQAEHGAIGADAERQ